MDHELCAANAVGILLSDQASEQEKYAASELQSYLEQMTSAAVPLGTDTKEPFIAVGRAAETCGVTFSGSEDGFRLKTVGKNLCVAGGKRGVIYGVYELLEKLGCRFFTATCEKVPFCEHLVLPVLDETQEPDFFYREHNYYEPVQNSRFAVKLRLNGNNLPIREKHGGHISYSWFVHSMQNIFPPEKYAASHPEYYAMDENGVRQTVPFKNQMCLSNLELIPIAVESVRQNLLAHPEARIISISQNDWQLPCHCGNCRKIDEEEGSSAGALLRFVNAVAEQLEPEFPDVLFDTLAYQYTRSAPKLTRPRRNVCVRLCSIECCFAHPFETCTDTTRGSFLQDLRDWHAVGAKLFIWDYTTCFNYYPTPHPNWRCLQQNMRLFRENGVCGVFEQANGASRGGTDLNELRAYLISKLLWNADADLDTAEREFTDTFYGAAGPFIREYIGAVCDAAAKEGSHVGFNDPPFHKYLDESYLDRYDEILSRAAKAVEGDALRLFRVKKAAMSIRYVRLARKILLYHEMPKEELNRFFEDWKGFGMTRMEEWCSPQTTHRAWLRGKRTGSQLYKYWAEEGPEEL